MKKLCIGLYLLSQLFLFVAIVWLNGESETIQENLSIVILVIIIYGAITALTASAVSASYEYGRNAKTGGLARRHKLLGNVQTVLWLKGEHGHSEDYWHDIDSSWWEHFEPFDEQGET